MCTNCTIQVHSTCLHTLTVPLTRAHALANAMTLNYFAVPQSLRSQHVCAVCVFVCVMHCRRSHITKTHSQSPARIAHKTETKPPATHTHTTVAPDNRAPPPPGGMLQPKHRVRGSVFGLQSCRGWATLAGARSLAFDLFASNIRAQNLRRQPTHTQKNPLIKTNASSAGAQSVPERAT